MWSMLEFFPEGFRIDILDVGAALGERPAYQSLIDAGRARIVGFEPNAAECERLNRTYGEPHRFLPYFIGDGRPATFHETNWALTGSLFEPNTPLLEKFQNLAELVKPVAQHPVSTTRLDDIPEIGNVDLVKIDIQGAELAVFRNARRALSGALVVQTEVEFLELYKGQPLFADVDTFLRGEGFQFHTFVGFGSRAFKPLLVNRNVNAGFRQVLWSDAVYVRDWMQLERLAEGKLRSYAVLAHDVLQSYDLAHLVLAALDRKTGGELAKAYLDKLVAAAKPGLPPGAKFS
jgi:FkbM family methyltransferase